MSFDAHKNFAYSTVATAPSPASSGTSLVVQTGDGAKFPAASFNATVWPAGSQPTTANAEIVRVTVVSTDTFTITRAQESTSARSIVVGDQIAATITAKTVTDIETGSRSSLVYRYTVAGSDKANIDTGVDTPDAGSNDWTGGDLLEVVISARTDDTAGAANINLTVNNDTGANYDNQFLFGSSTTTSSSAALAQTSWITTAHGSGGSASYAATIRLWIPNFTGTTFFKTAESTFVVADATATNQRAGTIALGWRSTAAITRFNVAAAAGQKLKVGTQLLIYKRLT